MMQLPILLYSGNNTTAQQALIQALTKALQAHGALVEQTNIKPHPPTDQQSPPTAFSAVVSILDESCSLQQANALSQQLQTLQTNNSDLPLFIVSDRQTHNQSWPKGCNWLIYTNAAEIAAFAEQIVNQANRYINLITPPFFRALVHYSQTGADSWHCPGHSGGQAFLKTPLGQLFHQFYGENLLRADVCNAVEELGQLLSHSGPVDQAEKNAARIFNADHLFFVTNGTSASNRMVWSTNVAPGDIVVVDRNCHKSMLHAIILTGAIPVFLPPVRNYHGLNGPIAAQVFTPAYIDQLISAHPLAKHAPNRRPKLLALTQSTYDGILYDVDAIKTQLDGYVDYLHFDEAWLAHAAAHPFYHGFHAIGNNRPRCKHTVTYATQSTHKFAAGLSQASQILVEDSEQYGFDAELFNEAYRMHASTSPQYAIIASCDVSAAMLEPPTGTALVEESLQEALHFRQKIQQDKENWFSVWGPPIPPKQPETLNRHDWQLTTDAPWHGFGALENRFNLLDPIKITVLTPGLGMTGDFTEPGIPAAVVSRYLAEHQVIVEKTGLYSFFVMFTIGVTRTRAETLTRILEQFKRDYQANTALIEIMPGFVEEQPGYYGWGLHDLCQRVHQCYQYHDIARLTNAVYQSKITPVMPPAQAWSCMARRQTQRIAIDGLENQISATLITPYPPGIPLLMPGERINREIVRYLQFIRTFNRNLPGFETDVHGLIPSHCPQQKLDYMIDCVAQSQ